MYNLTNSDEFLNGSIPIYEEIGPYFYREVHHKVFITFFDDGNKVQYWDYA